MGQRRPASRLLSVGALAFGIVFLVAACSGGGVPDNSAAVDLPEAYDFELTTYQGESVLGRSTLLLSKLRGQPVVLNFWAGLCPPCRAEMPDFESVYGDYKEKVLLLGIDIGPFVALGSREDGQKLLKDLGVTYPAGTTSDAKVVSEYRVSGLPTTIFITPDGKVVRKWSGLLNKDKMRELIAELLEVS